MIIIIIDERFIMLNINETKLYKKNIRIQNNMLKVYSCALLVGFILVIFKGIV